MTQPANAQRLFDAIVAASDALAKRKKAIDDRLAQALPELQAAIDKPDGPAIETYSAALEHALAEVEDALEDVRRIGVDLRELNQDKAFVAQRLLVIGSAAKALSKARDELTAASEKTHGLIDAGEIARKRTLGGAGQAQRELAQLRRWLRQDLERAQGTLAKAEDIRDRAAVAVEQRDDDALEALQKAFDLLPLSVVREDPARNHQRIDDWARRTIGKGLGEAADKALQQEACELHDKVRQMQTRYAAPLAPLEAQVMSLVIAEIDPRRAAAAADLAPGLAGKLGAVLNGTPLPRLEKALDNFARANAPARSGKSMIAALRREKLLH